jgi:hypothetical protein
MLTQRGDGPLAEFGLMVGMVEDLFDFFGEGVESKGFLEVVEARIGKTFAHDGIVGVPGHEDDFEAGTQGEKLIGEFAAVDSRHDNIGEEKIDDFDVLAIEFEAVVGVDGFEDVIAAEFENLAGDVADEVFIFDEKNGFVRRRGGEGVVREFRWARHFSLRQEEEQAAYQRAKRSRSREIINRISGLGLPGKGGMVCSVGSVSGRFVLGILEWEKRSRGRNKERGGALRRLICGEASALRCFIILYVRESCE